jgi:hypothetical protein
MTDGIVIRKLDDGTRGYDHDSRHEREIALVHDRLCVNGPDPPLLQGHGSNDGLPHTVARFINDTDSQFASKA